VFEHAVDHTAGEKVVKRPVTVGAHDDELRVAFAGGGDDFISGQAEAHRGLAGQTLGLHLAGEFPDLGGLNPFLVFEVGPRAQPHHFRIGFKTSHLGDRLDDMEKEESSFAPPGLLGRCGQQTARRVAEIHRNQNYFHWSNISPSPPRGQREIRPRPDGHSAGFMALWRSKHMTAAVLIGILALFASTVHGEDTNEVVIDDFAREELGVNELTAPSIQGLFSDLEAFKPIPIALIAETDFDRVYNNRFQTSLNFGALICDGFFAVLGEQKPLIQKVGRSLLRQAQSLAVGQRLSTHANSLLELGQRGDWAALKLELIKTQSDVEQAMIELRDEEMAHMVSLGGWLRGFEISTIVTAENYSPQRAAGLVKPDVMNYYLDRLETMNPRIKNTEVVTGITSRLETIRAISAEASGRPPSLSEVKRMRDLAIEINQTMSAQVDNEGRIIKAP